MTCHQGRASGPDVDAAIAAAAAATATTPSARCCASRTSTTTRPPRPCSPAAPRAATSTRARSTTSASATSTASTPASAATTRTPRRCKFDACASCHAGVNDVGAARDIRMMSSVGIDYDGDGNPTEGHLRRARRPARQAAGGASGRTARSTARRSATRPPPIPTGSSTATATATCSAAEAVGANGYKSWTPRLVRATYNFQLASKDPGAFAHNAKYIIQLLYDSVDRRSTAPWSPRSTSQPGRAHRPRPLQRRQRGGPPLGRERGGRRHLLACHGGAVGLPLLRPVRRRPRGAGDRQRPRVRHLPRQASATDFTAIIKVPSVKFPGRHAAASRGTTTSARAATAAARPRPPSTPPSRPASRRS